MRPLLLRGRRVVGHESSGHFSLPVSSGLAYGASTSSQLHVIKVAVCALIQQYFASRRGQAFSSLHFRGACEVSCCVARGSLR